MTTKEFVILGGNFAGIAAIKIILEKLNPKLGDDSYHVTLISPSTHVYFNLGAPRILVEPEKIEDVFFAIDDALAKYPKSQVSFIQGTATEVDSDSKAISYTTLDGKTSVINYKTLILATGARSDDATYKLVGGHENSINAVKNHHKSFANAKILAVAGGGPTGVETAGELAGNYKDKEIILYTGASTPLQGLGNLGPAAEKKLTDLGVKVVNGIKVESTISKDGQTVLQLSDGTQNTVDVYISGVGIYANTEFLDQSLLDKHGYVITDEYLRVKNVESIYALGDVLSGYPKTVFDLDKVQKGVLEATLIHDLADPNAKLIAHANSPNFTIAVPISKAGGVGAFKGWTFPNFVIRLAKARDFMIPRAAGFFGLA